MIWLKRNIFLILFALAAVAATGLGVWFFVSQKAADKKAGEALKKAEDDYKSIMGMDVFPSSENIAALKAETAKLTELSSKVAPMLVVQPEPVLDNVGFKSLLENTVSELNEEAASIGVELPTQYSFGFTSQRPMVEFAPGTIGPLTTQLKDIKEMMRILFEARVHALVSLKRVRIDPAVGAGSADYLEGKVVVTNSVNAVITPYELVVKGFSTELAAVLNGLQNSSTFFVVKSIQADALRVSNEGSTGSMVAATGNPNFAGGGAAATPPPSRSNSRRRTAAAAEPAPAALETVVDESPKKFTLKLEVVKMFQPAP